MPITSIVPCAPAAAGKELVCFHNSVSDLLEMTSTTRILHLLPTAGSLSFQHRITRYNVTVGDYVILPNAALVRDFAVSGDYAGLMFSLSTQAVNKVALRSNYGIIGHLGLLQNPVMKLSPHDFRKCRNDLERLRERLADSEPHLFREEMLGYLLMAHILDLYDIHARGQASRQMSEHTARLLQQFIKLLYDGEYIRHRDVPYYASRLCVTPHYLSEICKKACGRPATYWIDRFTLHEIANLLCQKELPLSEIAARMNFASVSYFSRYVAKHFGMPPKAYLESLQRHGTGG